MSRFKRPRETNQFAMLAVDLAPGQREHRSATPDGDWKAAHAVKNGEVGVLKGGEARAKALSLERRKEIAQRAAVARWTK